MMKLIHSCCLSCFPLHQIPVPSSSNTLPGCCCHASLLRCLAADRSVCNTPGMDASSEARYGIAAVDWGLGASP